MSEHKAQAMVRELQQRLSIGSDFTIAAFNNASNELILRAVKRTVQPVLEVASFEVTAGASTAGVAEEDSLVITAGASGSDDVKVTLNGVDFLVAVTALDTASDVAGKIRAATFAGWTTGGSAATVTFTATSVGVCSAPAYDPQTSGATGTPSVVVAGSLDSDLIIGINGVSHNVTVTNGDSIDDVAAKIRALSISGWTVSGADEFAIFTCDVAGPKTDGTFSANGTGVTATVAITQGVTAVDDVVMVKGSLSSNLGRIDGIDQSQRVYSPHDCILIQKPAATANLSLALRYHVMCEAAKCGMKLWIYEKSIAADLQDIDLSGASLIDVVEADILNPLLGAQ